MALTAEDVVADFTERTDISARSTLVTVFGDTLAPIGGEVWLSELFDLMAPFDFTERLLRTSMTRLVSAGWCVAERDGRRSRYSLSAKAAVETAEAEQRIYSMTSPAWEGDWTLVLAAGEDQPQLRWEGFARLGPGLWGLPHDESGRHNRVVSRLGLVDRHPVAVARFADLQQLLEGGRLTTGFELADLIDGYTAFFDRYSVLVDGVSDLEPAIAFAVRTILVHDLRRLRLRDPDLPTALLPDPWIGRESFRLAGELYAAAGAASRHWVEQNIPEAADHRHETITRFVEW